MLVSRTPSGPGSLVNFPLSVQTSFLGHVLRADGILTQDSKISAIKNWPPLTDIRSVRAFVSLCSYYRKYIWRFAEIAAPLTNLLKDGGWRPPSDPDVLTAVEKHKEALIRRPVLGYKKKITLMAKFF